MKQARIYVDMLQNGESQRVAYQGESLDETVPMPPDTNRSFHVYGDGQSSKLLFGDEPVVIKAEINIKSHMERILSHLRKGHIDASRIVIELEDAR